MICFFIHTFFWYLKTAILDTWKSLKSPWILPFQFAMNPVPTCLSCPEKGHKTNLSHSVPSSNLPQWLSCHGDGVAIVILLSCVNNSCDGNWCLIALLLQFELMERKQSRCGLGLSLFHCLTPLARLHSSGDCVAYTNYNYVKIIHNRCQHMIEIAWNSGL